MRFPKISAPLHNEPIPNILWIEVSSTLQIPNFYIVGLPAPEVAEARERVRSAILSSQLDFPRRRVVLNLSPASVRKQGTALDLPMALAVLSTNLGGSVTAATCMASGELGLDGEIKSTGQVTRILYAAWKAHVPFLFIPRSDYAAAEKCKMLISSGEQFQVPCPVIIPVSYLKEAWEVLQKILNGEPLKISRSRSARVSFTPEQSLDPELMLPITPSMIRILGAAAAGQHHLLILGPKGMGKSRALEWLLAIHPPATARLRLAQSLLHELHSPVFQALPLPIRKIGSHTRAAALIGGVASHTIRPGEYSLAHGGIIVADEFSEWSRDARESLREPLETGRITLSRVRRNFEMPAQFLLAATGNVCACGGWPPDIAFPSEREPGFSSADCLPARCICPSSVRQSYWSKLGGPVLDRIDIVYWMGFHKNSSRTVTNCEVPSLKEKVKELRLRLTELYGQPPGLLTPHILQGLLKTNPHWETQLGLLPTSSLRSRHKILKLALSLAGWDGSDPQKHHFSEAYLYRPERLGKVA